VIDATVETTTSNAAGSPQVEYEVRLDATADMMRKLLQVPKAEADEVHRSHPKP